MTLKLDTVSLVLIHPRWRKIAGSERILPCKHAGHRQNVGRVGAWLVVFRLRAACRILVYENW